MKTNKILTAMLTAGILASPLAYATNGYFPTGYGQSNEAMGGAGIALPLDSIAAANNPAGMVMVGDRTDFGLILFRPNRNAEVSGNICGAGCSLDGSYSGNGKQNFYIPSFGYNRMIDSNTSLGVSVFGNGGMNTQYDTNPLGAFGATGPLGINLEQLFVSPTWAKKVNQTNAVGVALNLVRQTFSATGLQPFAGLSSDPANLTNNGMDISTGYGVRVGWTGEVTSGVTMGATYQSKTKMKKFSKYSGLFAGQGSFDIPVNYGVGVAVKATSDTTVAFDVQRTLYSGVPAVGNTATQGGPLGADNGAGFGWKDMTAFKLGISYAYDPSLTLRAGVNHNDQQIPTSQTFLNVAAPGVVQNHLSLGATWKLADKSEVSVAYVHAFKNSVNGSGSIAAAQGGGEADISMTEDSLGISYGW